MSNSVMPWNAYWAENQSANSFEFDYSTRTGPYGEINKYWQGMFKQIRENSTVVDLGAGNGALANIYLQCVPNPPIKQWVNVDIAITKATVNHPKVIYQQGDSEALTSHDNSVDHFISMFGFEYANIENALREIKRCLKLGGTFHFVMHHDASVISVQSQVTVNVYERLYIAGLFDNLQNHLTKESLQSHLLTNLKLVLSKSKVNEQEDVKLIGKNIFLILQSKQTLTQCKAMLAHMKTQLDFHIARLEQQIKAANNTNSFECAIKKVGLAHYELSTIEFQNSVLAWQVSGKK